MHWIYSMHVIQCLFSLAMFSNFPLSLPCLLFALASFLLRDPRPTSPSLASSHLQHTSPSRPPSLSILSILCPFILSLPSSRNVLEEIIKIETTTTTKKQMPIDYQTHSWRESKSTEKHNLKPYQTNIHLLQIRAYNSNSSDHIYARSQSLFFYGYKNCCRSQMGKKGRRWWKWVEAKCRPNEVNEE